MRISLSLFGYELALSLFREEVEPEDFESEDGTIDVSSAWAWSDPTDICLGFQAPAMESIEYEDE